MGENSIYHLTSLCLSSYQRLIILLTPLKPVLIQATVQSFLMIHKGISFFHMVHLSWLKVHSVLVLFLRSPSFWGLATFNPGAEDLGRD